MVILTVSFLLQLLKTRPLIEYVDGAMHEAVAAIAACGVSPLVRIAANEGWMIKRMIPWLFQGQSSG